MALKESHVGNIRVLEPIARGGMGEVFLGFDERLERRVALKAVRRDRLGTEARARLLREARILSSLDDPRICQLIDYVEGQENDWLVMELLDGQTLEELEIGALSCQRRLSLAQQLAEVLVVTHAKGIVHRDLKPANLMVQVDGTLKVLDFGIARFDLHDQRSEPTTSGSEQAPKDLEPNESTQDDSTRDESTRDESTRDESTRTDSMPDSDSAAGTETPDIETRFGQLLGTLLYMSPEQARSERVGPSADLYSFGLILRQLLSGQPPFPPELPPPLLLAKLGRDERPDPSAGGQIEGDMARLVEELTATDPEHRPTAAVAARRLAWERGKAKRRRRQFLVTAGLIAILAAGLFFTLELRQTMSRSIAAQAQAEQARDESRELSDFLVGLFTTPDDQTPDDQTPGDQAPEVQTPGEPLTARSILERGAKSLTADLESRPRLRSAVALTLGEVYQSLGDYPRSKELLEESLRLRRLDSGRLVELASSLNALATANRIAGEYDAASKEFAEALRLRLGTLGEEHPDVAATLNGLAIVERRQGRYDEAEQLYLRSLAIREKALGENHPTVAKSLNNLGLLYYYQGKLEQSEQMYRRTLEIKEATLEPNHPSLATSLNNLANLLTDRGRFDEAEALYHRNLTIWEEIAGPRHPAAASALMNLGFLYEESDRFLLAEQFIRRALEIRAETLGQQHPEYAANLSGLGYLYVLWRRLDVAREALESAFALQQAVLPKDHFSLGLTLTRLAALELGSQQAAAARSYAESAFEIVGGSDGPPSSDKAFVLYMLALCDLAQEDHAAAAARIDEAGAIYETLTPRIAKHEVEIHSLAKVRSRIKTLDAESVSLIVAAGLPDAE